MIQKIKIDLMGKHPFISKKEISLIVEEIYDKFKVDKNKFLEIVFVDPDEMQQINMRYRGIDKATDVLSFPQANNFGIDFALGSIIICKEIADKYQESCKELIKHGLLHLLGYDHESDSNTWDNAANTINHKLGDDV